MVETPGSSNEDRLSSLPPHLINAILGFLSIKEVVKTSILSHQWRYRWTFIPEIVFNKECIPRPRRDYYYYSEDNYLNLVRRVSIVDKVLFSLNGPIRKFQCSHYLRSCPDIDRWITFLSKHPIEVFILQCLKGGHYEVPPNLFSYQDLRYLVLTNCIVQPPRSYSGLADLTTLKLSSIKISGAALERLLSTCKFLQELKLIDFQGLTHLEIVAPNLKRIYISGSFQGLHLDTPQLTSAEIDLNYRLEQPMSEGHDCNLVEALGCLPRIERLVLENDFLKFLAFGTVPRKLPTTYTHLQYVILFIDFSSLNQISAACCLIASAPNLQNLGIMASSEAQLDIEEFAWEAHDCQLNCLHSIGMLGITGMENELSLLGFVLANAPVLRTMAIQFAKNVHVEKSKFFKKLLRFRRASAQATIEYLEDE